MENNKYFVNSSIQLTQINVKDLQIGMYVSKLDRPWLETSFLFQGFELKTTADIKEVQQQCKYVFIDVAKQNISISRTIKKTTTKGTDWSYSQIWCLRLG